MATLRPRLRRGGVALVALGSVLGALTSCSGAQEEAILPGLHLDDVSLCDDPEQSGESTLTYDSLDPAGSSAEQALRSFLVEGSSPLATAPADNAFDATVSEMEQLEPGIYTVILPPSVRSERIEHIRVGLVRKDDGSFLVQAYSFCFAQ